MDYVALSWRTIAWCDDAQFMAERAKLLRQGWEVHLQAPWSREGMPRRLTGGACIMRRPKDEPRKLTFAELCEMLRDVWIKEGTTPQESAWEQSGHTVLTPDKPRKWTEGEIERVARNASLCLLRLERRNAELQAAIDEVVTVCRQDKKKSRDQLTTYAVIRNLYSLATKEETNG